MINFNYKEKLFVYDTKKWRKICETDYLLPDPPSVIEIKNGIILPLQRRKDVSNTGFMGGVCYENGQFAAGMRRNLNNPDSNLSCTQAYPLPKNIRTRHETVVFCGILYGHFGHLISDGFSRLWWYAEHSDTKCKLVFLDAPAQGGFKLYNVLEAAGITKDRMEIITEPTRFDSIIVPEESLNMLSHYRPGMDKIYKFIRNRFTPGPYKKIYLSRSALDRKDTVNEEYFESFYKRRGYAIVHPEQMPFPEQVSIIAGAEEIVMVIGTLVHLAQFCNPDAVHIVLLNRSSDFPHALCRCLQGIGADYCIIDAHFNFLPAKHTGGNGIYLLGPTIYWKQYLDHNKIYYINDEISANLNIKYHILDYIIKWGEVTSNPSAYKDVHNNSLINILNNINLLFLSKEINTNEYIERDDVEKIKKENRYLKIKNEIYENLLKSSLEIYCDKYPEKVSIAITNIKKINI